MWSWVKTEDEKLQELIKRKEDELEFIAHWRFGPKQRELYLKILKIREELEKVK